MQLYTYSVQFSRSVVSDLLGCFKLIKTENTTLGRMFSSVQFSLSVMSNSLWPHGLQHARLSCPSANSQNLLKLMSIESVMSSTISSSVVPFSSCLQSCMNSMKRQGCGENKISTLTECKITLKNSLVLFFSKINVHLAHKPAILILGIYLGEIKICVHKKTITWMSIAVF